MLVYIFPIDPQEPKSMSYRFKQYLTGHGRKAEQSIAALNVRLIVNMCWHVYGGVCHPRGLHAGQAWQVLVDRGGHIHDGPVYKYE